MTFSKMILGCFFLSCVAAFGSGAREDVYFYIHGQGPLTSFGFKGFRGDPLLREKNALRMTKLLIAGSLGVEAWKRVALEVGVGTVILASMAHMTGRVYLNRSKLQGYVLGGLADHRQLGFDRMKGRGFFGGLGVRYEIAPNAFVTTQAYINRLQATHQDGETDERLAGTLWFPMIELAGVEFRF